MRDRLRKIVQWVFGALFGTTFIAVAGQWFIQVAQDHGWYANAGKRWDSLMSGCASFVEGLAAVVTSAPSLLLLGGTGGAFLYSWADRRRRARDLSQPARPRPATPELGGPSAPLQAPNSATEVPVLLDANITPECLCKAYENHTSLEAELTLSKYLGKRMRFIGSLQDIWKISDSHTVTLRYFFTDEIEGYSFNSSLDMRCYFENIPAALEIARKRDWVAIEGTIKKINKVNLEFIDCRVLKVRPPKELKDEALSPLPPPSIGGETPL